MKAKNWHLFIILGLLGLTSGVYGQNYKKFKSILDDCGMNFTMPDGVKECKIIENDDMEYEYALKYPDKDFEVRYSIRPIRYKNYANEAMKNEIESQIPFRNSSYGIILQTMILLMHTFFICQTRKKNLWSMLTRFFIHYDLIKILNKWTM